MTGARLVDFTARVHFLVTVFFAEMLRTQAVQKWAEIRQADPFQSEVLGTRRFVNCLRLIRM